MITRYLFVYAALLVFAPGAFADGQYQRTRDGKTTVWNDDPKPGDKAAWSGERDDEGYAAGLGTLTWYTGEKQTVKRLGILPVTKSQIYARYFGNMVHGKFNGPVNAHANGKTAHAVFIDGARTGRWAAGTAPSRKLPRVEVTKQEAAPASASAQESTVAAAAPAKSSIATEPIAPAEGPIQKVEVRRQKAEVSPQNAESTDQTVSKRAPAKKAPASALPTPDIPTPSAEALGTSDAKPATNKKSQAEVEDSLFSLVGPPSSLHTNPDANGSAIDSNPETATDPSAEARLTKEAVVDLADAEARGRGYSPTEYGRADPHYNPADRIWSINYKPLGEMTEGRKPFSITIDDKTKGTVFVLGK